MGYVVMGGELVLNAVRSPGVVLAQAEQTIDGVGACQHELCPCLIVLGVLQSFGAIDKTGPHHSFCKAVQKEGLDLRRVQIVFQGNGKISATPEAVWYRLTV